ncbi:surfeit locus protein 5 subunit 22 of mediator complex domain-containing protein [Purpureocillium lavendulum]|uniref:Surfeit locus protein 5 subunit 22 of mediator complex domain-containing protein n=1 Tax=Purpureocillium lavendulum TaxID=1247861 RepID=A0AB34G6P1_9HYPO|nr:surfeit locus protein 5 subunit 22 of mediator complex domain-containing protein [Purpureocillium lavendulum]
MTRALQVTAAGWLLVALGHTSSAKDWQPQIKSLPNLAYTCAKAGCAFSHRQASFSLRRVQVLTAATLAALLNYAWSQDPELLKLPVFKAIAGILVAIPAVAGWYYAKRGISSIALPVGAIGALQAYSAFSI